MVMIDVHVLGSGGALPQAGHTPATYWIVVDGEPLLVDPGPGALVRLAAAGLIPAGTDSIGTVLLSHLHPDHSLDLVALLFAAHSPLPVRTDPLRVWGPPGLLDLLDRFRSIYGSWLEPRSRRLEAGELQPGQALDVPGGGRCEAFAVDHPQDRLSGVCLGFRFLDADGRCAVYSGDTGPCGNLVEAARGADLLVVECSTPDELATPGHMAVSQVAELCRNSRPALTVLTHQYPPAAALDLASLIGASYDGRVVQAVDGDVFTLPHGTGDSS